MKSFDVLVDCDDVTWDLVTPWIARINSTYGLSLKKEDITAWDMTKFVPSSVGKAVYDLLDDTIYKEVCLNDGVIEALREIREYGHKIFFVTSGFNFKKADLLVSIPGLSLTPQKNVLWADDIIFCRNKAMIRGHVIIDDRPQNLLDHCIKILFNQPWNLNLTPPENCVRVSSWKEIAQLFYDFSGRG